MLNLEIFSACNFIKKRLCHKYFTANVKKFLRTVILQNRAASNDMILVTFFCNFFFFLNRNGFLIFLMFFKSNNNDPCIDMKPVFYNKCYFLKTVKTSYIPPNTFSYLRKYLINQNQNYIRKDWSFRDQNFQFAAILYKKLKILIFIFFFQLLMFY